MVLKEEILLAAPGTQAPVQLFIGGDGLAFAWCEGAVYELNLPWIRTLRDTLLGKPLESEIEATVVRDVCKFSKNSTLLGLSTISDFNVYIV